MKELVELIAKALVDQPDRVQVSQLEGEQTTILELKVAPEDLGKVIGKQGRTARAIRIILGAAGMKLKRRFNLEIIEKALTSSPSARSSGARAATASSSSGSTKRGPQDSAARRSISRAATASSRSRSNP